MTPYEIAVLYRCVEGILADLPSKAHFGGALGALCLMDIDTIIEEVWARTEGNVPADVRESLCSKLEKQQ